MSTYSEILDAHRQADAANDVDAMLRIDRAWHEAIAEFDSDDLDAIAARCTL